MNDQQAMEIVATCMTDKTPLKVDINIRDAWLLVSAIQLATRHPELSVYMKENLFSTARQFQVAIEAAHPESHELIEMGWNTQYDGVDSLDEYDGVIPDSEDDFLQYGEPDDPEDDDE